MTGVDRKVMLRVWGDKKVTGVARKVMLRVWEDKSRNLTI